MVTSIGETTLPLGRKLPGEAILADDWNAMAGAIGELRAIDPEVKAIVSSGYSSDPVMANYRAHGFAAMIAKPYEVNEFARVLRETLN